MNAEEKDLCSRNRLRVARSERAVTIIDRPEVASENIEQVGFAFESLLTTDDLGIVKD